MDGSNSTKMFFYFPFVQVALTEMGNTESDGKNGIAEGKPSSEAEGNSSLATGGNSATFSASGPGAMNPIGAVSEPGTLTKDPLPVGQSSVDIEPSDMNLQDNQDEGSSSRQPAHVVDEDKCLGTNTSDLNDTTTSLQPGTGGDDQKGDLSALVMDAGRSDADEKPCQDVACEDFKSPDHQTQAEISKTSPASSPVLDLPVLGVSDQDQTISQVALSHNQDSASPAAGSTHDQGDATLACSELEPLATETGGEAGSSATTSASECPHQDMSAGLASPPAPDTSVDEETQTSTINQPLSKTEQEKRQPGTSQTIQRPAKQEVDENPQKPRQDGDKNRARTPTAHQPTKSDSPSLRGGRHARPRSGTSTEDRRRPIEGHGYPSPGSSRHWQQQSFHHGDPGPSGQAPFPPFPPPSWGQHGDGAWYGPPHGPHQHIGPPPHGPLPHGPPPHGPPPHGPPPHGPPPHGPPFHHHYPPAEFHQPPFSGHHGEFIPDAHFHNHGDPPQHWMQHHGNGPPSGPGQFMYGEHHQFMPPPPGSEYHHAGMPPPMSMENDPRYHGHRPNMPHDQTAGMAWSTMDSSHGLPTQEDRQHDITGQSSSSSSLGPATSTFGSNDHRPLDQTATPEQTPPQQPAQVPKADHDHLVSSSSKPSWCSHDNSLDSPLHDDCTTTSEDKVRKLSAGSGKRGTKNTSSSLASLSGDTRLASGNLSRNEVESKTYREKTSSSQARIVDDQPSLAVKEQAPDTTGKRCEQMQPSEHERNAIEEPATGMRLKEEPTPSATGKVHHDSRSGSDGMLDSIPPEYQTSIATAKSERPVISRSSPPQGRVTVVGRGRGKALRRPVFHAGTVLGSGHSGAVNDATKSVKTSQDVNTDSQNAESEWRSASHASERLSDAEAEWNREKSNSQLQSSRDSRTPGKSARVAGKFQGQAQTASSSDGGGYPSTANRSSLTANPSVDSSTDGTQRHLQSSPVSKQAPIASSGRGRTGGVKQVDRTAKPGNPASQPARVTSANRSTKRSNPAADDDEWGGNWSDDWSDGLSSGVPASDGVNVDQSWPWWDNKEEEDSLHDVEDEPSHSWPEPDTTIIKSQDFKTSGERAAGSHRRTDGFQRGQQGLGRGGVRKKQKVVHGGLEDDWKRHTEDSSEGWGSKEADDGWGTPEADTSAKTDGWGAKSEKVPWHRQEDHGWGESDCVAAEQPPAWDKDDGWRTSVGALAGDDEWEDSDGTTHGQAESEDSRRAHLEMERRVKKTEQPLAMASTKGPRKFGMNAARQLSDTQSPTPVADSSLASDNLSTSRISPAEESIEYSQKSDSISSRSASVSTSPAPAKPDGDGGAVLRVNNLPETTMENVNQKTREFLISRFAEYIHHIRSIFVLAGHAFLNFTSAAAAKEAQEKLTGKLSYNGINLVFTLYTDSNRVQRSVAAEAKRPQCRIRPHIVAALTSSGNSAPKLEKHQADNTEAKQVDPIPRKQPELKAVIRLTGLRKTSHLDGKAYLIKTFSPYALHISGIFLFVPDSAAFVNFTSKEVATRAFSELKGRLFYKEQKVHLVLNVDQGSLDRAVKGQAKYVGNQQFHIVMPKDGQASPNPEKSVSPAVPERNTKTQNVATDGRNSPRIVNTPTAEPDSTEDRLPFAETKASKRSQDTFDNPAGSSDALSYLTASAAAPPKDHRDPCMTIWVGNVSLVKGKFKQKEAFLYDLFKNYAQSITGLTVFERFAFVNFHSKKAAESAVKEARESCPLVNGQQLIFRLQQPPVDRDENERRSTAFLKDIPKTASNKDVRLAFGSMAYQIAALNLHKDGRSGEVRCYGFVRFRSPKALKQVISTLPQPARNPWGICSNATGGD